MSARGAIFGVVGAVVGFLLPPGNVYGAVALGAAGYGAGAAMDAADEQVEFAKKNQELQAQAANETLQRASENTKSIMREAETFKGEQMSSFVAGGVDISSQSSLIALENANAQFKRQAYLEERDASLTAQRINAQAQINTDAAKSARQATQIQAGVSVLGAAANVYGNRVGGGNPSTSGGNGGYSSAMSGTRGQPTIRPAG